MLRDKTLPFGQQLRWWRDLRWRSQLDFALDAAISQWHLSFLGTGRSQQKRAMVLRLSEVLEIPLRDRNLMLVAAGFAPVYKARDLNSGALEQANAAIRQILDGHDPVPELWLDRHWNVAATNTAMRRIMGSVPDQSLIEGTVNVLRLNDQADHPKRVRRQCNDHAGTGDDPADIAKDHQPDTAGGVRRIRASPCMNNAIASRTAPDQNSNGCGRPSSGASAPANSITNTPIAAQVRASGFRIRLMVMVFSPFQHRCKLTVSRGRVDYLAGHVFGAGLHAPVAGAVRRIKPH